MHVCTNGLLGNLICLCRKKSTSKQICSWKEGVGAGNRRDRKHLCLWFYLCFLFKHRQTNSVPESQICQRCAGTSCRFPVALVSRRSYSQSTQTHHSRHPLHSPGSAESQLERENRLGEGPYDLSTADTAADCNRRVGDDTERRHNSTSTPTAARITQLMWRLTISTYTDGLTCVRNLRA